MRDSVGRGWRGRWRVGVFLLLAQAAAASGADFENLLSLDRVAASSHVLREQRLVDGRVPAPTSPIDDFSATLLLDPQAFVRFDLPQDAAIAALQVVAVEEAPRIEVMRTGDEFRPVELRQVADSGRLVTLLADDLPAGIRALRVSTRPGSDRGAVAELLAFEEPLPDLPVALPVLDPPTYSAQVNELIRIETWTSRLSFVVALVALGALLLCQRVSPPKRIALLGLVLLLSLLGWTRFGSFQGGGRVLHAWDLTHYFLGSKYFPELGYRELYRCMASWERDQGRGFLVDRAQIRDLDDYRKHPGSWTKTTGGRCRATFEPARWEQFGADVDGLRRLFVFRRMHDAFKDHGYNATPLQTALLQGIVGSRSARPANLTRLAWLDFLALAGAVAALSWGFGPFVGAAAAALAGFGDLWAFTWTGGSLGRYFWLLLLCLGIALLKREHWLSGTFSLTLAGLLRLFPVLFLAGPALWALRSFRHPSSRGAARRVAAGVVLAVALGTFLPWALYGGGVFGEFFENSRLHAQVPSPNFMGMGMLVSAGLDGSALAAAQAGAGFVWRRGIWLVAVLLAGSWLLARSLRPIECWQSALLAVPLIFATIPLSSYDYVFLVVLVPWLARSNVLLGLLLGFAAATNLVQEVLPEGRASYVVSSVGLLLVLLVWVSSETRRRER